jgi:hypothetical protein
MFFSGSVPVAERVRLKVGAGGRFVYSSLTLMADDFAFASKTVSDWSFDPGFLTGFNVNTNGVMWGMDVMYTFPCKDFVKLPSAALAAQTYRGIVRSEMDVSARAFIAIPLFAVPDNDAWGPPRGRPQYVM